MCHSDHAVASSFLKFVHMHVDLKFRFFAPHLERVVSLSHAKRARADVERLAHDFEANEGVSWSRIVVALLTVSFS